MGEPRTIKKKIKVTMPEHTSKRKMEVVAQYQDNNYDVKKTAKQTGISEALVKEWHKELGFDIAVGRNNAITDLALTHQADIEKKKEENILLALDTQKIILRRLQTQIEMSDNPEVSAKALDAVTRAIKETRGESEGGSGKGIKKNVIYNAINAQYITQNKSKDNGDDKD